VRCRTRLARLLLATVVIASALGVRQARADSSAGEPVVAASANPELDLVDPVERDLAVGASHTFRIPLQAGQFVRVQAEQKTIDVVLSVFGPSRELVAEVDDIGTRDPEPAEHLAWIAAEAGLYRVVVRAGPSVQASGAYRLSVEDLRLAQPEDERHIAAERALSAGNARNVDGDYKEAALKYAEARALFHACGDRGGEAMAANDQAGVLSALNEFEESLRLWNEARVLFQAVGNHEWPARIALRIGNLYLGIGDWQRTLDYYEQARALYEAAGQREGEAFMLLSIGCVHYRRLGDHQRALEYYARALTVAREIGDQAQEVNVLDWTGIVQRGAGDPVSAMESYGQALALARATVSTFQEARILSQIGALELDLGHADRALALHAQALELAWRSEGSNRGGIDVVLQVLRSLAETYERLGRYDEALEQARAAVARAGQDARMADRAHYYAARLQRDRGDLRAAHDEISGVLSGIESRRGRLLRDDARASLQDETHDYFELAIDILMRWHQLEPEARHALEALQVAERMRARTLLDFLGEAGVDLGKAVDADVLARATAARRALDRAASHASDSPSRAAGDAEIRRLTEDYESARAEIRRRSPRYAALTESQPLAVSEIQNLLDPQTLVLEYALGTERSYLWVVSATDSQVYELAPRATIEAAVLDLRTRLSKRPGTAGEAAALQVAATRVASLVLVPAATSLRAAVRWVVVGDGALQAIPFAVLPFSPSTGGASSSGAPFVREREIVGLPSASVLAAIRTEVAQRTPAPKAVAVLADPVFEPSDPRVRRRSAAGPRSADTPRERAFERALEDTALRSGHIPRLPFTRREAAAAVGLEPRSQTLAALDFAASWRAATSGALAQYRIVHFASHGLLDAQHPELSGIVLSLVDESGRSQPGFLGLTDVYDLKLPAELVVLSGCQTGLGRQVRGEGLLGLTRGFMYAGAARVVSSLWKVDDRATAELMTRFYGALRGKRKLPPAAALRSAQASMAADARWRAPYYWAGFTLQGEWR
jgi:CHAT domain-containing protein